jgi:hypothetical protein
VVWRKGLTTDGPWVIIDEETRGGTPEAAEPVSDEPPAAPVPTAAAAPSDAESTTPVPAESSEPSSKLEQRRTKRLYAALAKEAEARGIDLEAAKPAADLSLLVNLARNANEEAVQEMAVTHIAGYEAKSAVPALLQLLDHPSPKITVGVIRALGAKGDADAIAALRELAASGAHPAVRQAAGQAAQALARPDSDAG